MSYRALHQVLRARIARDFGYGAAALRPPLYLPLEGLKTAGDIAWRFWHGLVQHSRPLLSRLLIGAALSNSFVLALPLFTMAVYDRIIPHQALESLWALALGMALVIALDLVLKIMRLRLVDGAALPLSLSVQAQFYERLLAARLDMAPRSSHGVQPILRDLDALCQLLPALAVGLLVDVPFFFGVLVVLGLLGGPVVIVPLVGVIALLGVYVVGHRQALQACHITHERARQQAQLLQESLQALETIKIRRTEKVLCGQWAALADEAAASGHGLRFWQGFSSQAGAALAQLLAVLVIMVGVYQIGAGAMTAGALSAAILLVGRAFAPVAQLVANVDRLVHVRATANGFLHILALPADRAGDSSAQHAPYRGAVSFQNIGFTYPGSAVAALQDVHLTISAGERVGLIGRVGSGKSTLLRLIPRLYEASSGAVLMDGFDVRQLDPHHLRAQCGLLQQDAFLFDRTVMENILFGLDEVEHLRVQKAITLAGLDRFAGRWTQGYSRAAGAGGCNLSGGERQAVALARLLVNDPRVLLMDEPTAGLDAQTERHLLDQLKQVIPGKTLVIATHRVSMLELVDRVIVLEQGRVILDGPRDAILQRLGRAPAMAVAG